MAPAWVARLNAADVVVRGYDVKRPESFGELAHLMTDDATAFMAGLTTLLLCARDIADSEELLFEHQVFAKRAPDLQVIVICATLPPRYVRALRGRIAPHIALVDAPFTGSIRAAQQGALSVLLGGPADAVAAVEPIFGPLAASCERMGGFGSAMAAKVMKDFLAASSTAMTRMALDWAQAQGIEERRLLGLIEETMGRNALTSGSDLPDTTFLPPPDVPGEAAVMAALVKEVESALDAALTGASLTPPSAIAGVRQLLRGRALH